MFEMIDSRYYFRRNTQPQPHNNYPGSSYSNIPEGKVGMQNGGSPPTLSTPYTLI
ncbi:hypothetical protein RSAG8_13970, partial [Rhizoctonia solani AG-8 WAC10335]